LGYDSQEVNSLSGVGVLDKAVGVLAALERGPLPLADLVAATGLSRATAHRLAVALEAHGLVRRDDDGRFTLGLRLIGLGHAAAEAVPGWLDARPALAWLQEQTGESVQLYVRDGDVRVCVESLEAPHELRTIVPVGASLPLSAGSAAKVFLAYGPDRDRHVRRAGDRERFAREVDGVARRGWASSAGERQPGVGSVSAPIFGPQDVLLGVVSVSGPASRMGRISARRYAPAVTAAAREIERALGG
jgi:DNA-binding IclR family transcriptional regulator